jgi:predicted secreted hydrolase
VNGQAWLDHEWSSTVLDPLAVGWDWTGINLDDGSALMAFRIRKKDGGILWQHASLRDVQGKLTHFADKEIRFTPLRTWTSPRTQARYPVAMQLQLGINTWDLIPLQEDQELDARRSTGSVYWEGGVRVERDKKPAGRGYLEMTGYVKPLKL